MDKSELTEGRWIRLKTLKDLQSEIETYIGMPTEILFQQNGYAELGIRSPKGVLLGMIRCRRSDEMSWHFGGLSDFLLKSWSDLSVL